MKKSAVNRHLFIRDFVRSWPVWVGMCIVYALVFVPEILMRISSYQRNIYMPDHVMYFHLNVTGLFVAVADFLLVLIVFGFANNPRSANFFFSLPMTRGSLFKTKLMVCLTVTFIPALVAGLVPVLYASFIPSVTDASIQALWILLSNLIMAHMAFLGMALLVITLVGQSISYAVIAVVVQFVPYMVSLFSISILRASVYGYSSYSYSHTSGNIDISTILGAVIYPLNHFISVSTNLTYSAEVSEYLASFILAAFGILCGVLAYIAFKRRKAESAGDIVVFKFLRPVFKYCVTACSVMFFTLLMLTTFHFGTVTLRNLPVVCLMIAVNAALGYFISEMLIQKKFNVFKGTIRGYIVSAAIFIVAICCVELDVMGMEQRVPNASEVERVFFSSNNSVSITAPSEIEKIVALHSFLINQKAVNEYTDSSIAPTSVMAHSVEIIPYDRWEGRYTYEDDGTEYYKALYVDARYPRYVSFHYVLKNGKGFVRQYQTTNLLRNQQPMEQMGELFYAITHTYEFANQVIFGGSEELYDGLNAEVGDGTVTVKLDNSQTSMIYKAIKQDMRDFNLGVDTVSPPSPLRPETLMTSQVQFYMDVPQEKVVYDASYGYEKNMPMPQSVATEKNIYHTIQLDTRAKNTLALLEQWGIAVK